MIAAIHQPQFMPWLGYFDKMDRADCLVLLDTVQYKRREWQNRNRCKTAQGACWLTVPVRGAYEAKISEIGIDPATPWQHKHWETLRRSYGRAPFWEVAAPALEAFYQRPWQRLAQVNFAAISWLREQLGITTPLRWASQLGEVSSDPTGRLVAICQVVGADTYLSGVDGARYMDLAQFADAGIEVLFQEYEHPTYPQLFGPFVSHLSALDLVLNCGPASLEMLRSGRKDGRA